MYWSVSTEVISRKKQAVPKIRSHTPLLLPCEATKPAETNGEKRDGRTPDTVCTIRDSRQVRHQKHRPVPGKGEEAGRKRQNTKPTIIVLYLFSMSGQNLSKSPPRAMIGGRLISEKIWLCTMQ